MPLVMHILYPSQPVDLIPNGSTACRSFFGFVVKRESILEVSQFPIAPGHVPQDSRQRMARACGSSYLQSASIPVDGFVIVLLLGADHPQTLQRSGFEELILPSSR